MNRDRRMPAPLLRLAQVALVAFLNASPVAAQEAPAADARFDVLEYAVEGNTLLSAVAIETVLTPFLGPNRPMADVEAARAALEKLYQSAGFLTVFVDVPEQRVEDGVVTLRVVQGRVERLAVTGSRYFSQGAIRDRVPEFAEGQVPNFDVAQRQLAAVNRDERRVQPVLRPGRLPGTVEVELKVADELPLDGTVELTNRHAADTDPLRLSSTIRYSNLFQRDHALALTAITAPQHPSQSTVLSATYTVPLTSGSTFVGYGLYSDSTLEPLGAATVIGRGYTLGARYVLPLPGSSEGLFSLSFGADYKDLRERVSSTGLDVLSTPVRYLPFQVAFNGDWADGSVQSRLGVTMTFAFRRLLARKIDCPGNIGPVDQFACKREGADGGFATLRLEGRQVRPLPLGATVSLRLGAQVATEPLVSSEQFTSGGAESVRGYFEAEAAGDNAVFGSLELQSANLARRLDGAAKPRLDELKFLIFADVARLYTLVPSAGQSAHVPLLGSGIGLRLRAWRGWSADLDVAWPLKATARTPERDPRLYARVAVKF